MFEESKGLMEGRGGGETSCKEEEEGQRGWTEYRDKLLVPSRIPYLSVVLKKRDFDVTWVGGSRIGT